MKINKKAITLLVLTTLLMALVPLVPVSAQVKDIYVDVNVVTEGDGTTLLNAFDTIQEGIDDAATGDTVIVAAGTYAPFTVNTFTGLTIEAVGEVIVEGVQSVITAYTDRDCVIFVKDSTDIVLEGLSVQGLNLGTINLKNYGIIYEASSGTIRDCEVSPNTAGNLYSQAIGIWDDSDVDIDTCILHNYGRIGVLIYNGCTVDILDSSIKGQVYEGEGEVCYGIEIEAGKQFDETATASQVTIVNTEVYNHDNTFDPNPTSESGGIYINGWLEYDSIEPDCTVEIENCDIHDNYIGIIAIKSPSSYANYNNIYDNKVNGVESFAAVDTSTAVFNAEFNWWGSDTGPTHDSNVGGIGDTVSDNVDYTPWLTALAGTVESGFTIDYVTSGYVQYGDTLTVDGSGVTAGSNVELYWDSVSAWDGVTGLLNTTEGNPSGTFDCTIDVPSGLTGSHYLWAKDTLTGSTTSYGPITMVAKLKISPSSALPGNTVTLKGYGYGDEEKITLSQLGMQDTTFSPVEPETDEMGYFTATFKVPTSPIDEPYDEDNTITATSTSGADTVDFTVGAAITLDVEKGPTGTEVEIEGRGFDGDETILAEGGIKYAGKTCYLEEDVEIKSDGTFRVTVYIPSVTSTGSNKILVTETDVVTPDGFIAYADASFEVDGLAEIEVTPGYGPQGSSVTVEGWNFTQGTEDVILTLNDLGATTYETDNDGHFEVTFIIPAVATGEYPDADAVPERTALVATQDDYDITAEAEFRAGIMIVILNPDSGPSGTLVTLTGTGFSENGNWDANFTDTEWIAGASNINTEISAPLYVPSVEPGIHTVSILDIDAEIFVEVEFEVTETTWIETDPVVAPAGYKLTLYGYNFAEDPLEVQTAVEVVLYNATEEWEYDPQYVLDGASATDTLLNLDPDWDDGYFEGYFMLDPDTELSIGSYTINVTDAHDMFAQLVFEIVDKTVDIDSRKPEFSIGETVAFNVESSFPMPNSYIEITDPSGDLYWSTDAFKVSDPNMWITVGTIQRVLYADQVAGGNPMLLLDDAPLGTWTWNWFDDENDEIDSGAFTVVAAEADVIAGQVTDLANDITELADMLTDVSESFDSVHSEMADIAAIAAQAVNAAEQAAEAVQSVAATANTASEAAENAAEAANNASDAADSLSTLVYGAIAASLVAALAAIVSLMQISKRIAG